MGAKYDRAEAIWNEVSANPDNEYDIEDFVRLCGLNPRRRSDRVKTHNALAYARRHFAYPANMAIPCDRSTNTYTVQDLWLDLTKGDIATHIVGITSTIVSLTELARMELDVAASNIDPGTTMGRLVRRTARNYDRLLVDVEDLHQEVLDALPTP